MKLSLSATLLVAAYVCASALTTICQAAPLESYGVAGDMDKKGRNPRLTVSATIETNQVTILADAAHANDDFSKYPVVFEFFVNGNLYATQYRSPTLPRPVGVTVPSSVATVPFNYVVVAKVIHPNSVYTTVIEAAAVDGGVTPDTFDCVLSLAADTEGGDPTLFAAYKVAVTQSTAGEAADIKIGTEFSATGLEEARTIEVAAEGITGSAASGTVTVKEDGKTDVTFSGDVEVELSQSTDKLRAFIFYSEDTKSTLDCGSRSVE